MIGLLRRTRHGEAPTQPQERSKRPAEEFVGLDDHSEAERARTRGALSRAFIESDPDFARGLRKMTVAQRNYILIELAVAEGKRAGMIAGPFAWCTECNDLECTEGPKCIGDHPELYPPDDMAGQLRWFLTHWAQFRRGDLGEQRARAKKLDYLAGMLVERGIR